jgi:hypothetical protein
LKSINPKKGETMNLYACVGKVIDIKKDGKHLKFTLSIWQEKPCLIPCVIFNPKQEDKDYISSLLASNLIIWLQGRLINYEVKIHGTKITIIELATNLFNVKEILQ